MTAAEPKDLVAEADLYYDQGLMDEASGLYRTLIEAHRKTPGAEEAIKHAKERLAEIEETMEPSPAEAAPAKERDGQTVFSEGTALMEVGELVLALERFQEAMTMGHNPMECLVQSVNALGALGRYSEAVNEAKRLVEMEGLSEEDRSLYEEKLADVLKAAGQGDQSLKIYLKLMEEGRGSEDLEKKVGETRSDIRRHHLNTARLYLKKERPSLAAMELARIEDESDDVFELYQEVVAKQPNNRQALQALARMHMGRDELPDAAVRLRELISLGEKSDEVVGDLREIYTTLVSDPDHVWEARYELANLKIITGDAAEGGQELLDLALEDNPFKLKALLKVAEMKIARGESQEAAELMEAESEAIQRIASSEEAALFWQELARAKSGVGVPVEAPEEAVEVMEAPALREVPPIEEPLASRGAELLNLSLPDDVTYQVLEPIGAGPLGAVYKVEQSSTGRVYAAKMLREELGSSEERLGFLKKYALFNLNMYSPQLTLVVDLASVGERHFLITEYVEASLYDILREQRRLSLEEAVDVTKQILQGLGYAHAHRGKDGIVRRVPHLGIKPTNILLRRDLTGVKLSDLGLREHLAVHLNFHPPVEERSAEELPYLTPEHYGLKVRRLTERASIAMDIYSFGTVLFHILTGFPPFRGPTVQDYKTQHLTKYPVPPKVEVNTLPIGVDALVLKCLEKLPKKRWRSAPEVDLALDKSLLFVVE